MPFVPNVMIISSPLRKKNPQKLTFMLQRPSIQPLNKILKINHIDLLQMQTRSQSFPKSIVRIECRGEERRARQQDFEMERERMGVGTDGEGDWSFEEMSKTKSD